MKVFVLSIDPPDGSSVRVARGICDEADPVLLVSFGVDHRCADNIFEALAAGEDVECEVEGWQVLGSRPILEDELVG